jgi:hypothetical protein
MGAERADAGPRPLPSRTVPPRRPASTARPEAGSATGLQRQVGNRTAALLLRAGQAKLDVGPADDRYEREADTVAGQVVAALRAPGPSASNPATDTDETVARRSLVRPAAELRRATVDAPLRRAAVGAEGGTLDAGTEAAIRTARRGGTGIEAGTRTRLEGAFGGADFSAVRLHTGAKASELNERVQASAFTVGSDIFFRGGLPDTSSTSGQALLAHELTHTIQQGG